MFLFLWVFITRLLLIATVITLIAGGVGYALYFFLT